MAIILLFLSGREEETVTCIDLQKVLESQVWNTAQDKWLKA